MSKRRGALRLAAAGLAAGVHWWVSGGAFVAVEREGEAVERLFVSRSWADLAMAAVAAPVLLLLVHWGIRRVSATGVSPVSQQPVPSGTGVPPVGAQGPSGTGVPPVGAQGPSGTGVSPVGALFDPEDVAWTAPLLALWVSPLAILAAVPGVAQVFPAFAFVLVDLRWWWTAAIAAATLVGAWRRVRGTPPGDTPPRGDTLPSGRLAVPRLPPALALAALCGAWVVLGTPHLRFSPVVHGDEAKYLRYCENFYQGHGLEISSIRPIAQLPPGFAPRFGRNLELAAQVLPGELRNLAADARVFLSDPSHKFARSMKARGFVRGKNGGVYQVHQPGLSVLMLPAYSLDRWLSVPGRRSPRQWPPRLVAVNAFFLSLYLVWVVLVYRLAVRLTGDSRVAATSALAVGATLPVAAFPFQFYPEAAAGIVVIAVAGHVFFPLRRTPAAALAAGFATGCLPWLHVRFVPLAVLLAAFAMIAGRREGRRVAGFVSGAAIPTAFLLLYVYRVTGSILPTSLWAGESGALPLSALTAVPGSVAYLLDRRWGLLAHAPIYLLALPGWWLLARQRRDLAWFCALGFLAVLLPAAAHTLHAAATTPCRLIAAVVPLAALPLAVLLTRSSGRRWLKAAFAVLLALSVQNALAYNWWHVKPVGWLVDQSFSGWKVNLLFPARGATPWVTASNGWLYVAWVLVLVAAFAAPLWFERRGGETTARAGRAQLPAVAAALALVALLGTAVAAATGSWEENDYRRPNAGAAGRAAALLLQPGERLRLSSERGRIGADAALAQLATVHPSLAGPPGGEAAEPSPPDEEENSSAPR